MPDNNTFTSVVNGAIQNWANERLNVCLPGRITAVKDVNKKRVTIQLLIKDKYFDDTELEFKEITNVPLLLPYDFGDFIIKPPVKDWVGQDVLVMFSQRSLDNYLSTGELSVPKSRTKFSKNDAFAIPGLSSFTEDSPNLNNNDDMEIIYGGSNITIKENGDVNINNGNLIVKAP